ncbi:hypothetical protein [Stenotrophomonas maltophilia]|uniref:hypothetical protein n=1 Tax=Stenotrophomonas maltophilia TaxID=40324 RepID=UPI000DA6E6B1|nr:hypothetical protein [Stenotrophomonas maltophilia]MBA0415559.1 hypothetical protein [Stenotrophomonas maltophilia]MBH1538883.1 hypothetical protein [Stenotrophomonas maltophilia]MBH1749157.1 hypothetical protein [Stenotrophomonas maltophilia]PZS91428.1 hypothetical protein A7X66_01905 [Stenotrophomonas maltophilia]HDS1532832.1 hypothetical protein [Stenotrophomonas maltophilia]
MGIEQELDGAISATEMLVDHIEKNYGNNIDCSLAHDAVERARKVLGVSDEPTMQHAWVEVTVAQASLSAHEYAWCKSKGRVAGIQPGQLKVKMNNALASTQNALRQILAKSALLDAVLGFEIGADAVIALLETTGEDAGKVFDSAAAWIYEIQDKTISAAHAKADAEASASASNSSNGNNISTRKLKGTI